MGKQKFRQYFYTTMGVFFLLIITLFFSNLIINPLEIAPKYNLAQEEIISIIEKHEQKWMVWNFRSYTFRLKEIGAWWSLNVKISVKNGELEELICFARDGTKTNCPTHQDHASRLEELSIPSPLFNEVRAYLDFPEIKNCLTVNFHPIFSFPEKIIFDCPDIFDEDDSFVITDFFLLP